MDSENEDRIGPPENEGPHQPGSDVEVATTEHLSEFAGWLEARLDALDNRLDRFDRISTRNTRQIADDMVQVQTAVSHLHDRHGQLISGTNRALRELLREEIRAALEEERRRMARAARNRVLWTIPTLIAFVTALVFAALWGLDMLPWHPPGGG